MREERRVGRSKAEQKKERIWEERRREIGGKRGRGKTVKEGGGGGGGGRGRI